MVVGIFRARTRRSSTRAPCSSTGTSGTTGAASASSPLPAAADGGPAFLTRLARRVERVQPTLCLGIDPDPEALPRWLAARRQRRRTNGQSSARLGNGARGRGQDQRRVLRGVRQSPESRPGARPRAHPGRCAVHRRREAWRHRVTTAARQATALYDALDAHAVTASPYLGGEAIAPLLERTDRFVYVLCRTSNPGAGELQNLQIESSRCTCTSRGARRSGHRIARTWASLSAQRRQRSWRRSGSVVPQLPFLVPGVGAQGGDVEGCCAMAQRRPAVLELHRAAHCSSTCHVALRPRRLAVPIRRRQSPRPPSAGRAPSSARMSPCRSTSARSNSCSSWSSLFWFSGRASCLRWEAHSGERSASFRKASTDIEEATRLDPAASPAAAAKPATIVTAATEPEAASEDRTAS